MLNVARSDLGPRIVLLRGDESLSDRLNTAAFGISDYGAERQNIGRKTVGGCP